MDATTLWAKSHPFHPLWCHLLDVGAVCGALLKRFGPIETVPDVWVMYLAALHDIGKADPEFQNKDEALADELRDNGLVLPQEKTRFRHEARSAEWIVPHLQQEDWHRYTCRVISMATRAHHGDFKAGLHGDKTFYDENEAHLSERTAQWNGFRRQLADMVRETLDLPPWTAPEFDNASSVGIRLAGLIVLADWIASNAELYGYETLDKEVSPSVYFASAKQRAAEVIHRLEFDRIGSVSEGYTVPDFTEVWPQIVNPRPFQTVLESACRKGLPPGLAILEAPMGEGKTEAAIYLALHWNRLLGQEGVYIALPTMATSNQMYTRYEDFLATREGVSPRLIHGMSWLYAQDQPEGDFEIDGGAEEARQAKEWFGSAKRAILAPEAVGTVDQALMAALNVKHGFLRFLGLSARILIIDEVHAYDVFMTTLMRRLLAWCRTLRIPIILLSATLSRAQKLSLIEAYEGEAPAQQEDPKKDPYPLLTFVPWDTPAFCSCAEVSQSRTVKIERHYGMLPGRKRQAQIEVYQRTAALGQSLISNGGCLCILMNTVSAAQEVYKALGNFPHKLLFHARFPAHLRNEIENKVLHLFGKGADGRPENPARPVQFILVCTQVVEQSLDVDFDGMITQLAPIDLLLQRTGRIWRHERGPRLIGEQPVLNVLLPKQDEFANEKASVSAFGATGRVYTRHEVLLHTLVQLEQREAFLLPKDFRSLIESCYNIKNSPQGVAQIIFDQAVEISRRQAAEDENAARLHLIVEPSLRDFVLGKMSQEGVEEGEDGEAASYFRARTRLGDETRNALLVEDVGLEQALLRGAAAKKAGHRKHVFPGKTLLGKLFLQKVGIPAWWLQELEPDTNYAWLRQEEVPDWARHHTVFFLQNGEWHGRKGDVRVLLQNDPELGVVLIFMCSVNNPTTSQTEEDEDADVGSPA